MGDRAEYGRVALSGPAGGAEEEGERRQADPFGRRAGDVELRVEAATSAASRRRGLTIIGTVIGLSLFAALQLVSCSRDDALDRERRMNAAARAAADYADCREDNLAFAYQRVVAMRFPSLAQRRPRPGIVLPILWCRRTVAVGHPVRLPPGQEIRYLNVYKRERLPLVDDATGRVVGDEPLPAAGTP